MRCHQRNAVHRAQAFANPRHPRAGGGPPGSGVGAREGSACDLRVLLAGASGRHRFTVSARTSPLYPRRVPDVSDHTDEVDGLPVFWRSAPAPAGVAEVAVPPLYLHGVPNNSDDWLGFLERTGGLALDLPGFGRSGKPGFLRYTIEEYGGFLERFLEHADVERVQPRACTTGVWWGWRSPSATPSASSGS